MQDSSKQQVCVTKWNYQSYAINNKVTSPLCIFVVYVYISFFKNGTFLVMDVHSTVSCKKMYMYTWTEDHKTSINYQLH